MEPFALNVAGLPDTGVKSVEHYLAEVRRGRPTVACCSCGWRSAQASGGEIPATWWWQIHVDQHRAAAQCARAWAIGESARSRNAELAASRDVIRGRRMIVSQQRAEVRAGLDRAAGRTRDERVDVEQMLECARKIAGFSIGELWLKYFALGGKLTQQQMHRVLTGVDQIERSEYTVLSVVFNEEFCDDGFGYPLPAERGEWAGT